MYKLKYNSEHLNISKRIGISKFIVIAFIFLIFSCANFTTDKNNLYNSIDAMNNSKKNSTDNKITVFEKNGNEHILITDNNTQIKFKKTNGESIKMYFSTMKRDSQSISGLRSRILQINNTISYKDIESIEIYAELPKLEPITLDSNMKENKSYDKSYSIRYKQKSYFVASALNLCLGGTGIPWGHIYAEDYKMLGVHFAITGLGAAMFTGGVLKSVSSGGCEICDKTAFAGWGIILANWLASSFTVLYSIDKYNKSHSFRFTSLSRDKIGLTYIYNF